MILAILLTIYGIQVIAFAYVVFFGGASKLQKYIASILPQAKCDEDVLKFYCWLLQISITILLFMVLVRPILRG